MKRGNWWRLIAAFALIAGVTECTTSHGSNHPVSPAPISTSPSTSNPPLAAPSQDPVQFAKQVVSHAHEAGVNPQLVMAILYNESYKPHDPATERAWLRFKPNASLGIANMHEATFDEAKQNRSFANRDWQELSNDPDLAIQAAAWYLHDLNTHLPAEHPAAYTTDELLALGYNAGPDNMRAYARGATPAPQVQTYLDTLRRNWTAAGDAVRQG